MTALPRYLLTLNEDCVASRHQKRTFVKLYHHINYIVTCGLWLTTVLTLTVHTDLCLVIVGRVL